MTIKQLGGVFGRNPTFNDVTIEGTLTFDGDIDINSDLKVDGNLEVTGTSFLDGHVGIGVDPAVTGLHLQGTDNVSSSFTITNTANSNTWKFQPQYNALQLRIFGQGSEVAQFDASNNFNLIGGGNLVVNSGNGIDFSATAGTGSTSELLDDYEEGAFTPTYQSVTGGSWTYTSQTGTYTKIGNMVNVRGQITTSAGTGLSGNIQINLPYTAAANTPGDLMVSNLTKTVDSQLTMFTVGANTRLYEFRNNGPYAAKTYADLGAAHTLFFSISYTV